MMEFEKKILLTEEEYQAVLKQRSREGRRHRREHYVQKNHYYDTEDLSMNRQGITCRIREKGGLPLRIKRILPATALKNPQPSRACQTFSLWRRRL